MKKFAASMGLLLALPLLFAAVPCAKKASANSAPAYWAGSDGMGVVAADGNCPVEVAGEKLSLNIPALPESSYSSQAAFEEYEASVTAEYTFRNPTGEALTVGLAFPFGQVPEYLVDRSDDAFRLFDDSARYGVEVGGKAAETTLRYTYYRGNYGGEDAITLPADEKAEQGLYREDAAVYAFSYAADTQGKKGDYVLEVRLSYSPARTRILRENYRDYRVEDGDLLLFLYLNGDANGDVPARFFALGEEPQIKSVKVVKDENLYEGPRTYLEDAAVTADGTEETFGAWVEEARPAHIGETDWYNAVLAYLGEAENTALGLVHGVPSYLSETWLMRWFTYSLEIPQGGTVVNRVTAPVYPDISGTSRYDFRYLLSPAQGWADFGTFELGLTTPFKVTDCSLPLEKTEDGYRYAREGLPLGELEFTISLGGNGLLGGGNLDFGDVLAVFFLTKFGVQIVGAIVAGIVLGVLFHRKKKRAGKNPSAGDAKG